MYFTVGGVFAETFSNLTMPDRNFFMKTFDICEECKTITILVAPSEEKNDEILESFKKLSISLGKNHAGSVLNTESIIMHSVVLMNSYNCDPRHFTKKNYVIYIDVDEKNCLIIPYKKQEHLSKILMLIVKNIDDSKKIRGAKYEMLLSETVELYFDNNPKAIFVKELALELVMYVSDVIGIYSKTQ